LKACKRARDQGKRYIAFQKLKQGGYRLIASREKASCYDFGFGTTEWAQNLLYRLVDECLADFTYDDIDAYLAKLNEVTAPAAGAGTGAGDGMTKEMIEMESEAYYEGYNYYWHGGSPCSYEQGTNNWADWHAGWEAAAEEDDGGEDEASH